MTYHGMNTHNHTQTMHTTRETNWDSVSSKIPTYLSPCKEIPTTPMQNAAFGGKQLMAAQRSEINVIMAIGLDCSLTLRSLRGQS